MDVRSRPAACAPDRPDPSRRPPIVSQTAICVRPTAAIPRIFPERSSIGVIEETRISTTRSVFSWMTPRITSCP